MRCHEKLDVIKTLDGAVLSQVTDEQLADKIEQADEYKERIYATMVMIEKATTRTGPPTTAAFRIIPVVADGSRAPGPKVRLPKLTIKPFNGNLTNWMSFWDSYKSSIHESSELSNIDKFNYLKSLVTHSALDAG